MAHEVDANEHEWLVQTEIDLIKKVRQLIDPVACAQAHSQRYVMGLKDNGPPPECVKTVPMTYNGSVGQTYWIGFEAARVDGHAAVSDGVIVYRVELPLRELRKQWPGLYESYIPSPPDLADRFF